MGTTSCSGHLKAMALLIPGGMLATSLWPQVSDQMYDCTLCFTDGRGFAVDQRTLSSSLLWRVREGPTGKDAGE